VIASTIDVVDAFAKGLGFSTAVRAIGSLACGLAAGALAYVLLVRYRVKDGSVCTISTPDAWQRDDVACPTPRETATRKKKLLKLF